MAVKPSWEGPRYRTLYPSGGLYDVKGDPLISVSPSSIGHLVDKIPQLRLIPAYQHYERIIFETGDENL